MNLREAKAVQKDLLLLVTRYIYHSNHNIKNVKINGAKKTEI